ncbi:MAG: HAMP domain-containing histidine kinase [Lachnospiraceae bacterium]|nr:HAMP domain-containing histidine kinase [Lachnospiraceae bacterium]
MSESKRMSSIARKINFHFWLKRFSDILFLDIVIVTTIAISYILSNESLDIMVWKMEKEQWMVLLDWFDTYVRVPAIVLGACEGFTLISAMFDTSEIRRDLKPLNDLAVRAEKLSRIDLNDLNDPLTGSRPNAKTKEQSGADRRREKRKLENLGHVIENISPDELEKGVHTGDADLQGIEVALNNLLLRMRENQKQQARFVSDASHELRTPIAVIQGYVNMLDRWGKTDEAVLDESIEALKNESEHMKTLVEQLLFLARGDSGRNTLNKTEMDLNDVVKDVWEESTMIDEKHVYVFEDCPHAVMHGDVAMVKQSLRIFIQNAAKYSNEGDTIKLKVMMRDGHPAYVVQDEGIGMQESDIAHIFERFYRSDSARNSQTGGSGLGLSIAKWIIDAHEGQIEVLSRPEFGTRFTVTF